MQTGLRAEVGSAASGPHQHVITLGSKKQPANKPGTCRQKTACAREAAGSSSLLGESRPATAFPLRRQWDLGVDREAEPSRLAALSSPP